MNLALNCQSPLAISHSVKSSSGSIPLTQKPGGSDIDIQEFDRTLILSYKTASRSINEPTA